MTLTFSLIHSTQKVGLATLFVALMVLGCSKEPTTTAKPAEADPPNPYRAMKAAVRKGQWKEAWKHSEAVLVNHPDEPEVLAAVARIAHENQEPDKAADLLVAACRAESFRQSKRVQQAMVGLIGVGRLHEGMLMLEDAVAAQPDQHETRRWLYDFYMGTENRLAGLEHGRTLVRNRQFDLELLLELSNTQRRSLDADPLVEMTKRNPNDKRPQLGPAKTSFDEGDYEKAIETLGEIVAAHPDYGPAQSLLGRCLATVARWDEYEAWIDGQTSEIEAYPNYWISLGDWASAKQQPAAAARAYWESCRRDPDIEESWLKLGKTLRLLRDNGGAVIADDELLMIENRTSLLSKLNQEKHRFTRTGKISRATANEIVLTLDRLGRLWEAEAWAAVALTLPEDDAIDIEATRAAVVAKLQPELPWQTDRDHPELLIDYSSLALPAIIESDPSQQRKASLPKVAEPGKIALVNEAKQRGLDFFGRTSDTLDQPGIMLFRTLGCGGGSIDYDLDGWTDLYLVAAGGTPPKNDSEPNELMRNLSGSFRKTAELAGVADTHFGQGVAVGDVNEDGFPDLLVLNYGPNTLYINNGDGTFQDASARLANNGDTWSTSAAIADIDGDQLSDIVVVNYCAGFEPVTRPCPMKGTDIARSCTPVKFEAASDQFFRCKPDGSFGDATETWQANPTVPGRGLGIVAGSLDQSEGTDVFIANDMTNNHFWKLAASNAANTVLSDCAIVCGLAGDDRSLAQGSMGIAVADLDRDLDIDVFVTNFEGEYNTYHEQRFPGIWQDRTSSLQLHTPTLPLVGFGTAAIDLDHNGLDELLIANGHVEIFQRGDEKSLYEQPMQLFQRTPSGGFEDIAPAVESTYLQASHVGRALWSLDANGDSMVDFAVTHQTEPVALLINQSEAKGNWIALELVGTESARDAIGTQVIVRCDGKSWMAGRTSGDGYLCSDEATLRVGLGDASGPCDVEIRWPSGEQQSHRGLMPNRTWLCVESQELPHSGDDPQDGGV